MGRYRMPIVGSGTPTDPYRPKYVEFRGKPTKNQAYDMATMLVDVDLDLTREEEAELLKDSSVKKL